MAMLQLPEIEALLINFEPFCSSISETNILFILKDLCGSQWVDVVCCIQSNFTLDFMCDAKMMRTSLH